jgi:transposase
MKGLKGRKSDQQDAEWIADLTRLGLIKPSFVPPPDFRALREFLRTRRGMIQARTTLQNETLKTLEIGGVKLSSFMSSVFGVSGMGMLRALARGESVAEQVHLLAKGKLRSKLTELRLALAQPLPIHLQQILAIQLERMDQLEGHLASLDARVEERMAPYEAERRLLTAISGLGRSSVNVILAEIGVDMGVFPTPAHLAAWAGLAPGSFETGGKHKRASTLKGNIYLKTILVECAGAAVRAKGTFFSAKFNQLRRRGLDYRKALVAIAHKLIVVIHRVLSGNTPFQDLGAAHFEQRNRARTIRNLTRRLETLGFAVSLQNLSIESESLQ